MRYLAPIPSQFLDENGEPYYGGMVHVYVHGEPRHAEIYQNAQTDELAQNPFPLDSHGSWQAFVDADKTFDYLVMDSGGNVVARFPEITFPTGEGVPEVSVVSPDGSINVNEVVDETGKTFEIEVNRDILEPSYSEFSHDTVTGNGGAAVLDSFTLESDADADIYLTEGVLTFKKGLYHVSMNLVIGNSVESGAYYDIVVDFGGNELKKTWDGSFVHEESVELGMDVTADQDGHTVIPSIVELPEGMYCRVSRLDVHKVGGAGVGGSVAPIEHDGSLEGDGTHGNPLGVKDYSEIRTDLAEVIEGLDSHKTDQTAHQDIRDELERKEDKDNKVTSWGGTLSDEKYPSEKLVKDTIDNLPPGTAVKGDAESEYRTGNVNLTPADLGAKPLQTAVSDPTASGSGLSFIDSVSQDANGVITPHKKTVQDGTTSQKGVVQLNNAIDSSSTTEAATPKAVKDAYDELNNKIVARAVFLSQQEWTAQSLLPGDPAKVYYVENGTGEDAYTVYVWKESTSTYEEVDESSIDLDGYWHDGPTTTGNGNVVTSITLGNDGVPQVEKGLTALTQHQDISGKADKVSGATSGNLAGLDANGNLTDSGKKASDFEPSFSVLPISKGGTGKTTGTAATNNLFSDISSDTNDPVDNTILVYKYTTPSDNAGIFYTRPLSKLWNYIKGKISSVLGLSENGYTGNAATATTASGYTNDGAIATALGEKYVKPSGGIPKTDLASDVQTSLGKADSALQAHQSVTDSDPTLSWGTRSKVGSVGTTDLHVTMPANPASGKEDAFIRNGSASPYVIFEKDISTSLYDGQRFEMVSSWGNNTYKIVGRLRFPATTSANPLNGCSLVFASYPEKPVFEFYYKLTDIDTSTRLTLVLHLLNTGNSVVTVKPNNMSMDVVTTYDTTGFTRLDTFPTLINMRDASWINSGTFGTDRIADDAITAAKVKDNETLPVNVSGTAKHLDCYGLWHTYGTGYYNSATPYAIIGELSLNMAGNTGAGQLLQFELDSGIYARIRLDIKWSNGSLQRSNALIIDSSVDYSALQDLIKIAYFTYTSGANTFLCIRLYVKFTGDWQVWRVRQLDCQTGDCGYTNWGDFPLRTGYRSQLDSAVGTLATYKFSCPYANGQKGSTSIPVYVDSDGQVKPCTPSGGVMKSNAAELYIAGYEGTIPYYNVRGIKNGCVNYVHVKDIPFNTCSITIDAPTLVSGEEYDYVVVFDTFTNSNLVGNIDVENCKKAGHMDNGVFVVDTMALSSANPHYVPMIVVTGNVASSKWYERT